MRPVVTLKQLIVGVFVLAIVCSLGSRELVKRRNAFLYDVTYHARRETEELRNLKDLEKMRREKNTGMTDRSLAKLQESSRLRATYHAKMKRKFQSAANHPWRNVGPIPEEPGEDLLWEGFIGEPVTPIDF